MTVQATSLRREILSFCSVQERILRLFSSSFPLTMPIDVIWLPKRGVLDDGACRWNWVRHGLGVRFESPNGEVVDAHTNPHDPSHVDVWRVELWLHGKGCNGDHHDAVVHALDALEVEGAVKRLSSESWRFLALP